MENATPDRLRLVDDAGLAEIRERLARGESQASIACDFQIHSTYIRHLLIKGHCPPGRLGRRPRLNEGQIAEIRERAAAGEMQRTLAREFGLSESRVSRLLSGR